MTCIVHCVLQARVALARAVYYDADLYLLDDPLAAVDAHVGQHLFQQCVVPLQRRGKCILMVTNALQYVRYCSRIVVFKDGRITESGSSSPLPPSIPPRPPANIYCICILGSYSQLLDNKSHFSAMMAAFQDTKDDVNGSASSPTGPAAPTLLDSIDGAQESKAEEEEKQLEAQAEEEEKKKAETERTRSSSISTSKGKDKKPEQAAQQIAGALITTEDREVDRIAYFVITAQHCLI